MRCLFLYSKPKPDINSTSDLGFLMMAWDSDTNFQFKKDLRHFRIDEELSEFNLAQNCKAFWIPADYDTNEFRITTSRISEISSLIETARDEPLAAKAPSKNLAVQTPLMAKS
jgi:hypothetical protein